MDPRVDHTDELLHPCTGHPFVPLVAVICTFPLSRCSYHHLTAQTAEVGTGWMPQTEDGIAVGYILVRWGNHGVVRRRADTLERCRRRFADKDGNEEHQRSAEAR